LNYIERACRLPRLRRTSHRQQCRRGRKGRASGGRSASADFFARAGLLVTVCVITDVLQPLDDSARAHGNCHRAVALETHVYDCGRRLRRRTMSRSRQPASAHKHQQRDCGHDPGRGRVRPSWGIGSAPSSFAGGFPCWPVAGIAVHRGCRTRVRRRLVFDHADLEPVGKFAAHPSRDQKDSDHNE
jgi:hypothetical protein